MSGRRGFRLSMLIPVKRLEGWYEQIEPLKMCLKLEDL